MGAVDAGRPRVLEREDGHAGEPLHQPDTGDVELFDPVDDVDAEPRVTSERLVSFSQRAILAIRYTVEPTAAPTRVVVQSELVTNEPRPAVSKDPRAAAALEAPLESEEFMGDDMRAVLVHRTKESQLRAAAAMGHEIDGPEDCVAPPAEAWEDLGRLTITATPGPGEPLTITKYVSYGWSARRSVPAMRDQVSAALAEARHTGWDELVAAQRNYLDDFWERADVELDGDAELQQAVRFGLFHALQASARGEGRAIPAKGLTGPGYDGHTFWDTEAYVLPVLISPAVIGVLFVVFLGPDGPLNTMLRATGLGFLAINWTVSTGLPSAAHFSAWALITFSAEPVDCTAMRFPQASSRPLMPPGLPFCTAKTTYSRTQSTKSLASCRDLKSPTGPIANW